MNGGGKGRRVGKRSGVGKARTRSSSQKNKNTLDTQKEIKGKASKGNPPPNPNPKNPPLTSLHRVQRGVYKTRKRSSVLISFFSIRKKKLKKLLIRFDSSVWMDAIDKGYTIRRHSNLYYLLFSFLALFYTPFRGFFLYMHTHRHWTGRGREEGKKGSIYTAFIPDPFINPRPDKTENSLPS